MGTKENPIAYATQKLTDTQRNWAVIEKQAYAIICALKTFDPIIFGVQIFIMTDHNPLWFLTEKAPKNSKQARWSLLLPRYNFQKIHR